MLGSVDTAALAALQVATLQVPSGDLDAHPEDWSSPGAAQLAKAQGFTVLGRGSSRVAVEVDGGVGKVSHHLAGLAWNLQEAAAWLTFPHDLRQHLTPCLTLTPELVLIQERVEVCGPPLIDPLPTDAWLEERDGARRLFADSIYTCRERLGLGSDPDLDKLRCNNFGVRRGHVVMIDSGDQFPPLYSAWARLLGEDGVEQLTIRDLAERAGLTAENTDDCPDFCGGTWSEPAEDCGVDRYAADVVADHDYRMLNAEVPTL